MSASNAHSDAGKLTARQLDLLLLNLGALPTSPEAAEILIDLACRKAWEPLLQAVQKNPAVTLRLLKLANQRQSGVYCLEQAVQIIGQEGVFSVCLSTEMLPKDQIGLDLCGFQAHSQAVALVAEKIVRQFSLPIDPRLAYTCGLLHDIGKLLIARLLPKSYRRTIDDAQAHQGNIAEFERTLIGLDHMSVGRRLLQYWKLDTLLQQTVWMHHLPVKALPVDMENPQLAGVISLADALVRKGNIGFSGNYVFPLSPEGIAQSLGLDATQLPQIDENELLPQNEPPVHFSPTQALNKAVQHLGQLNEELLERQTRMSRRTRNLQAIQQFVSEISDTSTLSDLVLGIARAAVRLFPHDEKHPLAAYSISQQAPEILAAFYGSSSPATCITLPAEPRRRNARFDGLGSSAQKDMQELLDDLDELWRHMDVSLARHEPLLCRGEWIGGILYVPKEGASLPSSQEALIDVMSMALAVVQSRCDAVALSEQLAGASQILSETQEALAEAKTLSAVGEMAAGAAHEMNNPLAVISGRAQLMRERAENEKDRKIWNTIAEQTQRVSDIISDLMEFAAPTKPNPSAVNIAELFMAARNLFYQSDTAQVSSSQVDISIGNPLPKAWVDRGQIESALTELITNAAIACGEKGKISLAAEYDELTAMVRLTVIDEGPGMDASTLSQAFTPFFSLQKAGRRRGLGLPRVKRQVEINGGQIRIDSQPGRGTRVQMYLPSVK